MKKTKQIRGFYKPKSYRLSEENHKELIELGKKFGSQNKAITILIESYKSK